MAKTEFCKKKTHFPTNLTKLNSFFVFHACAKAKILDFSWRIYFDLSLSLSFIPSLLAVLLPTLSSFFCMELWLANILGKGQI